MVISRRFKQRLSAIAAPYRQRLRSIRDRYWNGYARSSYSQEGEDLVLLRLFENQKTGFYVDVGAHHPHRFSNTFVFYERGWCGINIDAMPRSMELFDRRRPKDINLQRAVSSKSQRLTYYRFEEPALNGFTAGNSPGQSPLVGQQEMETTTLAAVLDEYLPPAQVIDFLTVDVEGLDLDVLKSNNWSRYRPGIVLAEAFAGSLELALNSEMTLFMKGVGYELFAQTCNTVFFRRL